MSPGQKAREEAFWQRYEGLVRGSGVRPGLEVWHRRHCEAFIRSIRPQRLAEAGAVEVTRFLHRRWQGGRLADSRWPIANSRKPRANN